MNRKNSPVFKLVSEFKPAGSQPDAISALTKGLVKDKKEQILLGVTGSGKTFTIANVIANIRKPTLVIAPNKTLAAQLFQEFKALFPENAVEYFVSYYDYYQPEAYIPTSDTYIQKDSSINEMIDKLRHSATRSVLSRQDVVVVASVSCIFGLGAPEDYLEMRIRLSKNQEIDRERLLKELVLMQYKRNDLDFYRGLFRVRGDRVEIFPTYEEDKAVRIDFFGDEIEAIAEIDALRGTVLKKTDDVTIFPASHYVTSRITLQNAIKSIVKELKERVDYFRAENLRIEEQRIEERTNFDLEMMQELGYCHGIENYSRHLTGRSKGEPPPTLMDYFPEDFLIVIDESHISIPQLNAMFKGDRSRKETLALYGFRLPSALDNRPLRFEEFKAKINNAIYVSATPGNYEIEKTKGEVIEQVIRPTGLIDPKISIKKAKYQVDDLYEEILKRVEKNERILVTALTKRMAEDLTDYYSDLGIKTRYLHSDIKTMERIDIIRDLRYGEFDVLVGINLLREGLDIPEVSLVAILDADKEGFLRSERSLIQTCGRAARNLAGEVIMYADVITKSMKRTIKETNRRRKMQQEYNKKHGITPTSINKKIKDGFEGFYKSKQEKKDMPEYSLSESAAGYGKDVESIIKELEADMFKAADNLEFEKAAVIRDKIEELNSDI
ncbi:MAG: excinuclease ABC subunit UvrB [Deltaproteobacteria bacterium]|nr:excinuclease ABC subunit UvrB [Deltaproteobacteria bacterium]